MESKKDSHLEEDEMIKWILLAAVGLFVIRVIQMIKWSKTIKARPCVNPFDLNGYCWCLDGVRGIHGAGCPIPTRRENRAHIAVQELESLPPAENLSDSLFGKGF